MVRPWFFCVTAFVCPQSPYCDNDMLLWIFNSCCPLSSVLHVTLANLQKLGFEFHLRSSPSAFNGCSVDQSVTSLLCCTVLTSPSTVSVTLAGIFQCWQFCESAISFPMAKRLEEESTQQIISNCGNTQTIAFKAPVFINSILIITTAFN